MLCYRLCSGRCCRIYEDRDDSLSSFTTLLLSLWFYSKYSLHDSDKQYKEEIRLVCHPSWHDCFRLEKSKSVWHRRERTVPGKSIVQVSCGPGALSGGNVIVEEHCGIPAHYALSAGYRQGVSGIHLKAAHLPCTGEEINQYNKLFHLPLNNYPSEILFGNEKASDAHGTDDAEV